MSVDKYKPHSDSLAYIQQVATKILNDLEKLSLSPNGKYNALIAAITRYEAKLERRKEDNTKL